MNIPNDVSTSGQYLPRSFEVLAGVPHAMAVLLLHSRLVVSVLRTTLQFRERQVVNEFPYSGEALTGVRHGVAVPIFLFRFVGQRLPRCGEALADAKGAPRSGGTLHDPVPGPG